MKELENIDKLTNEFFDYIDKDLIKHTWTLEGKGYFDSESQMELEIYLEDLIKDESYFKLIGVHKNI